MARGLHLPQARTGRRTLLLPFALLLAGCADGDSMGWGGKRPGSDAGRDGGSRDGALPDSGERDAAAADAGDRPDGMSPPDGGDAGNAKRGFREPCERSSDCLSGYCIDDGEGGKVCTRPCNDDCPAGWDCLQLVNAGGDAVFVCFPVSHLCKPCRTAQDCGGAGAQCLAIGDGTFCGLACSAGDCPDGYVCQPPGEEAAEGAVAQCVPADGWCTPCRDEDGDGLTGGPDCVDAADCDDGDREVHRGATERCDGKDNDCDGETDEIFDLANDPRNCGECGRTCTYPHGIAGCADGRCALAGCVDGWHACNDDEADGCEYECQVTHGGAELCDTLDNDCDCAVDEDFDLQVDPDNCGACGVVCPLASCGPDGPDSWVARGDSVCSAGRCTPPEATQCGLYTCIGGGGEGNRCARRCEDDTTCVAAAHCEPPDCVADRPDGAACAEDRECASGRCANGFCCRQGVCCSVAADCPAEDFAAPPRCDLPSACQGSRVDAACSPSFECLSVTVNDDTACGPEVVADECGLFLPLHCDGTAAQQDVPCPTACAADEECDPGAHCDGLCLADREDGEACDEHSDCAGGRCANGFCCAEGDCCAVAADCPAAYTALPACDVPRACQGSRKDPLCTEESACFALVVEDDSACTAAVVADGCDLLGDLRCTGEPEQVVPQCPTACEVDGDCDPGAHCDPVAGAGEEDPLTTCVIDLPDGASCDEDSDCTSRHCANGFCCHDGDCCAVAGDCPAAYAAAPRCDAPAACQGSRVDPVCDAGHRCGSSRIDDDSACDATVVANACGLYLAVHCNGAAEQNEPTCPAGCLLDEECDPGAHCDGTCHADLDDGRACDEDSDCASRHCANGFCCAAGDCCATPAHCPAAYSAAPSCDAAATCQGHRLDATCLGNVCGTSEPIPDDRGCAAGLLSDECGLYQPVRCTGEADQPDPPCPAGCARDADCDADAHCDGTCQLDLDDGHPCDEASDCVSGHCQNGFCCAGGDCCAVAGDCPAAYTVAPRCEVPSACQGSRLDAVCDAQHRCASLRVDDDSACTADVIADECGLYVGVHCTGEADQQDPPCPGGCVHDAQCDPGAHCNGTCQADLGGGQPCQRDSDCISNHCQNGYCCASGDCCATAANCPAAYTVAPQCDAADTCQGHRNDATCIGNVCGTSGPLDDDRGCAAGLVSDECGLYRPVTCNGQAAQSDPPCPQACQSDDQCDPGAHCDGTCLANLPDGRACDENSDCSSGHCQNGFCCSSGDCCAVAADCPARYAVAPVCDAADTCQGHRHDPVCEQNVCATGGPLEDDRGCGAGLLSDACGLYPAVYCNGAAVQLDPPCPQSCLQDADCDAAAHCDGGQCLADLPAGQGCDEPSDCQEGLFCVDGVCCTSSCNGLCQRCDLSGNGTCSSIPNGQDPDGECGAVGCAGYYWGWLGSTCYRRADAPAGAVACNGGGACQTAAQVCPSQSRGGAAVTCDAVCQQPNAATCSGTTMGTCTNIEAGNLDCGVGECRRTPPRCTDGRQNVCVPGNPAAEVCDNKDNDCDGTADDGIAGAVDGYEPNGSCNAPRDLGTVAEESSEQNWSATIYPADDEDHFAVYAKEDSSFCFPGWPESFSLQVRLVPPQGVDCQDYDLYLYDDGCGLLASSSRGGCETETITYTWSGNCAWNDSRNFRIRVIGFGGRWDCVGYTLYADMWQN